MTEFSQALSIAASGMTGQATRIRHVSENIANADTPGYRRKVVGFEAEIAPRGERHRRGGDDGRPSRPHAAAGRARARASDGRRERQL